MRGSSVVSLFVSIAGHIGAILMTLLVWQAHTVLVPSEGAVVPVEIVDVAPESNVQAMSADTPEGEEQQDQTQQAEPAPAPAPTPAPTPPPPRPRADNFDLSAIARMVDKSSTPGTRHTDGAAGAQNRQGVGLGTANVASMQDRVRALAQAAFRRCWRMPIDLPNPDRLVVTVRFSLNRNGTLNGQPTLVSPSSYPTFDAPMRAAVDAALRAVRTCDPYPFADDPVVGDHYEVWRDTEYTFTPPH